MQMQVPQDGTEFAVDNAPVVGSDKAISFLLD
jgi:hypothetical protein